MSLVQIKNHNLVCYTVLTAWIDYNVGKKINYCLTADKIGSWILATQTGSYRLTISNFYCF